MAHYKDQYQATESKTDNAETEVEVNIIDTDQKTDAAVIDDDV